MMKLSGRTAVVSGAGEGIGRALALALAGAGVNIAILDVDMDAAEAAAEAAKAIGRRALAVRCDVSILEDVNRAKVEVCNGLGKPDIVWANAGVGSMGGILSMSQENLDWLYGVNVTGILNVLRSFASDFTTSGSGDQAIGLTASVSGYMPLGGYAAAYGATKHAVVGIGEALRAELAGTLTGVTILCPGLINTRIWDAGRVRPERFGGETRMPDAIGERWRTNGMAADWVAGEALAVMRNGGGYVSPVDPHSKTDYRDHVDEIVASFRFPSG